MLDWPTILSALILSSAILFWPEQGLLARWRRRRWLHSREAIEDALKHLHQRQHAGRPGSTESLAGALDLSTPAALALVQRMEMQKLLNADSTGLRLSIEGHRLALQVVRTHRLFERYLADETQVPPEQIHTLADRWQHRLSAAEVDKLEADLGYPVSDPHGDPIPTAGGDLPADVGHPLLDWPLNTPAQIVHIEDEPPAVYAQIVAERLVPGMVLMVVEKSAARVVLESETAEHVLAPIVAANLAVRPAPQTRPTPAERLTGLPMGERRRVVALDQNCQGLTRRRFLDLGITPGALVEPVLRSAFREPTAYRVRDTLIALRREQSDMILVAPRGE